MSDALLELAAAFPVTLQLLQIDMTISVSTAKCERCLSALKRIKTYLCNSMSEKRLTDLAVLSIERDLSDSLELDLVVGILLTKTEESLCNHFFSYMYCLFLYSFMQLHVLQCHLIHHKQLGKVPVYAEHMMKLWRKKKSSQTGKMTEKAFDMPPEAIW